MPVVQLPDGTHVTLPDPTPTGSSIFPGWAQDLAKYGPGFLKETGKIAGRGFLTGLANMGEAAGNLAGEGMRSLNVTNSPKPQEEIAAALPDSLGNSPAERLFRSGVEGAGGALALPMPGVGLGAQALTGAAGGLGGESGALGAENLFPNSPKLQAASRFLGSLFAGSAAGFHLGPKQTQGQREVRQAAKGLTPEDFTQAEANAVQAGNAGAKTATAAEMFPPGSGIMALAAKTRAMGSDNPLRVQTTNRPGDMKALADEFLNRIRPGEVDPNTVATGVNKSADVISKSVDDARSAAMNAPMKGVFIDPAEVTTIARVLNTSKSLAERQGLKDAYQAIIDNIMPGGKPIQRLSDLSLAITEAKPGMGNPNNLVNGASQVSPNDLRQAVSHARDLLSQASPEFKKGLSAYESMSKNVVEPFQTSPIDKLTSTNPYNPSEGRIGQVSQVIGGSTPRKIQNIAADLGQAPGAPTSPLDIARALAQQKVNSGPMNPGNAVRGTEGSNAQAQFEALLNAGGNDAAHTMAPLAVADRLQPFLNPASMNDIPKMGFGQALLRPFRTADMAITGHRMTGLNEEVGRLLANPSPENIRRLQEISMFDPNVRRIFSAKSGLMPAVTGQEN